jgi:ABC-2 type transport system permease protein
MSGALAIFEREFKSYFYSPVAYLIIAVFAALTGFFFYLYTNGFVEASLMADMQAQQYRMEPQKLNVNLMLIRPFFWNIAMISLFTLPTLTMRLYSEEKRQGTVELLYTAPVSPLQIILGKYTAGLAFYAILLLPTIFYQSLLFWFGNPELMPVVTGYLGLILIGSAFIAAGLWISTMTENQIIAALGGFALSLLLWIIGAGAASAGETLGAVLNYISIINHFEDFAQGVIDSSHVLYYVLFTLTGLYFSLKTIESVKWRA